MQAKERSYETMLSFGKRSLNIAASAAVQAATKVLWVPVLTAAAPLPVPLSQSSSESCALVISYRPAFLLKPFPRSPLLQLI